MSQYEGGDKTMSFKQVAKWLKSKGRGKLRNYCTMCARQFRDKKGLKNHMGSKQHLENMRDFNENPEHYLQKFSDDFKNGFLKILITKYGDKQIFARTVYTEYVHILHHRHLNSTIWESLDAFVEYLGKEGICKIEKSPKGYYIQYIQKDDGEIKKTENVQTEISIEEQRKRMILKQVKFSKRNEKMKNKSENSVVQNKNIVKNSKNDVINLQMNVETTQIKSSINVFSKKRKNQFGDENEKSKKIRKVENTWIMPHIIVKILHKKLGKGKYYKKKGKISKVVGVKADVEMLKSGDIIQINQKYLETVIPKLDSKVMIVTGKHKGIIAVIKQLKIKQYSAVLELKNGETDEFPYEEFSKI